MFLVITVSIEVYTNMKGVHIVEQELQFLILDGCHHESFGGLVHQSESNNCPVQSGLIQPDDVPWSASSSSDASSMLEVMPSLFQSITHN